MEFVIGQISGLMDARFAAAAGTERVILNPWPSQGFSAHGTGDYEADYVHPAERQVEILKQTLATWNEIKDWVAGPEIWLAVPSPCLSMALEAYSSLEDCCGIMVPAGQPYATRLPSQIPPQIPPQIPYALDFSFTGLSRTKAWSSVHPPEWVVVPWSLLGTDSGSSEWANKATYVLVESLEGVDALQTLQELPSIVGIYLQAKPGDQTDYEAWQQIIDRISL